MKIISSYHKKLHFQVGDESVGIEPNKIVIVGDEMGRALLNNPWITEARESAETPIFRPYRAPVEKKEETAKKIEEPVEEKKKMVETPKEKKVPIRKKTKGRYIK